MTPKQLEQLELEGTWEEIVTHSAQLAGRKVRVIVLTEEDGSESNVDTTSFASVSPNPSTAATLLKNALSAGTWEGDDFEECLQMVYDYRGVI